MQLISTVDAEADNQWDVEAPQTTANLDAVPRVQRLCDKFGYPPTYLCTHEVVTSPRFRDTTAPCVVSVDDPTRPGDSGLLEVPVTILHTSRLMRRFRVLRRSCRRHRRSLPWRAAD